MATASGSWLLAFPIVFIVVGLIGLLMQFFMFSKMEGEELRQTLVTHRDFDRVCRPDAVVVGRAIVSILAPQFLQGPMELPLVSSVNDPTGEAVTWLRYPPVRVWILVAAIVIGIAMWLRLEPHRGLAC